MEESNTLTNDFGKLVEIFIRQAQLILASLLVCVLAAVIVSLLTSKSYQARVLVATTKVASSISLGSAIQTTSDENLSGGTAVDRKARLQSYVQLVKNPLVAQAVLDRLKDRLTPSHRTVTALLNHVEGTLVGSSDTIAVQVTYPDPDMAAEIANAWGEAYVQQVNQIYTDETTNASFPAVQQKTIEARQLYDQAQADLEAFIAINQIGELNQKISVTLGIINSLDSIRLSAVNAQTNNIRERLDTAYQDSRNIDQYLIAASDIRDQVKNGGAGAAASNALALNLLKAKIFTSGNDSQNLENLTLQISLPNVTEQDMTADLDSLIAALQQRRTDLLSEIQSISSQLLSNQAQSTQSSGEPPSNPPDPNNLAGVPDFKIDGTSVDLKIQELQQYVRSLQEKMAHDEGRQQELSRARDLAWTTYTNLASKQAELSVITGIQGKALSLASPATVPENDTVNSKITILIAAAAGLMLGGLCALALEFWWKYQGLEPVSIRIIPVRKAKDRTKE